jgi:hypothetical protein
MSIRRGATGSWDKIRKRERYAAPLGEWRLHKTQLTQAGDFTADVAFGTITELVTGHIEPVIFVFLSFDSAWLASAWPFGDQIGG